MSDATAVKPTWGFGKLRGLYLDTKSRALISMDTHRKDAQYLEAAMWDQNIGHH